MRLIDADKAKTNLRLGCRTCKVNGSSFCKTECIINRRCDFLDEQPTVEPFEPDYVGSERLKARQRGYADGYHNGMEIGKTLNPKIKQGEWVIEHDRVHCSSCGHEQNYPSDFCPNCGAEMKGGAKWKN